MFDRVALLVFTDGRNDCLDATMRSFDKHVKWPFEHRFMIDDTARPENGEILFDRYPEFEVLPTDKKLGFCGSVERGWKAVPAHMDYVFHLEDDFVFKRDVNLMEMMRVLRLEVNLQQIALRRQAWSNEEKAAGGIVEQHPESYTEKMTGAHPWISHRRFFTTNPSLYRRSLIDYPWPEAPFCEGKFHHALLERFPDLEYGFWGSISDDPWVEHIGDQRVGFNY